MNGKPKGGIAKGKNEKPNTKLTEEQRQHYIEIAAYYISQNSKSNCGCDLDNWLIAEAEIDRLLAEGRLKHRHS